MTKKTMKLMKSCTPIQTMNHYRGPSNGRDEYDSSRPPQISGEGMAEIEACWHRGLGGDYGSDGDGNSAMVVPNDLILTNCLGCGWKSETKNGNHEAVHGRSEASLISVGRVPKALFVSQDRAQELDPHNS